MLSSPRRVATKGCAGFGLGERVRWRALAADGGAVGDANGGGLLLADEWGAGMAGEGRAKRSLPPAANGRPRRWPMDGRGWRLRQDRPRHFVAGDGAGRRRATSDGGLQQRAGLTSLPRVAVGWGYELIEDRTCRLAAGDGRQHQVGCHGAVEVARAPPLPPAANGRPQRWPMNGRWWWVRQDRPCYLIAGDGVQHQVGCHGGLAPARAPPLRPAANDEPQRWPINGRRWCWREVVSSSRIAPATSSRVMARNPGGTVVCISSGAEGARVVTGAGRRIVQSVQLAAISASCRSLSVSRWPVTSGKITRLSSQPPWPRVSPAPTPARRLAHGRPPDLTETRPPDPCNAKGPARGAGPLLSCEPIRTTSRPSSRRPRRRSWSCWRGPHRGFRRRHRRPSDNARPA